MEWKSSKIAKKIFEIKLEGRRRKRRRGRPRMRWLEDAEKDLREIKAKNGDASGKS